jgi:hypothetical protein
MLDVVRDGTDWVIHCWSGARRIYIINEHRRSERLLQFELQAGRAFIYLSAHEERIHDGCRRIDIAEYENKMRASVAWIQESMKGVDGNSIDGESASGRTCQTRSDVACGIRRWRDGSRW